MPYYAVAVLGLGYDSISKINSRLHKSKIFTFELSMISGALYHQVATYSVKNPNMGVLIRANFGPIDYALLCCGSLGFRL